MTARMKSQFSPLVGCSVTMASQRALSDLMLALERQEPSGQLTMRVVKPRVNPGVKMYFDLGLGKITMPEDEPSQTGFLIGSERL